MAKINTKLIKYATQARFDIDIAKVPAVIDPKSIVFVEDTGRIYVHGKYFGGAWGDISNKPNTFAPAAHKHGSITNDGKIGTSADRIIETTTGGTLTHVAKNTAYNRAFGTGVDQVARGNHTHAYLPLTGGKLTGDLEIFAANTDKFIKFAYNTTDAYSWRIGYLGTGAGNENRLAFQSAKTSGASYVDALSFGLDDLVGKFAVTPTVGDTKVSLEGHTHPNFTRTVAGLVPAPGATTTTRYLREDGTWKTPPNTTYTAGNNITINSSNVIAGNYPSLTKANLDKGTATTQSVATPQVLASWLSGKNYITNNVSNINFHNIVPSSPRDNNRRFFNVAQYHTSGNVQGVVVIELPGYVPSMEKLRISGWGYSKSWDIILSGYSGSSYNSWLYTGDATILGNPPFGTNDVQLAASETNSKFYILLGTPSTVYGHYLSISVDAESYYSNSLSDTGWDIYVSPSEPSTTSKINPITAIYGGEAQANKFIIKGGKSTQFLKADGSVDSNTYITASSIPSEIPISEIDAGTSATVRTITGRRVKHILDKKSDSDHNHTLKLIAGASTATTNSTADVANPYIRLFSDNTHQGSIRIVGDTNVGAVSKNGTITLTATDTKYTTGTLDQLNKGTDTTGRLQTAKLLNDWLNPKLNGKFDKTGGRLTAGTGDVNIELWRGTNASWNILNSGGYLRFQSNYTTVVGAYFDALKLDYNTGNALFKGNVTAPTFIGNASSATKLKTARTIAGVSFNGTEDIAIPFANLTSKPTTLAGYKISDAYTKAEVNSLANYVGRYNYANGFLVKTNVARTENSMLVLHIKGNSYGGRVPINTFVQVYNYVNSDYITQTGALNNGYAISEVKAFYYNNLVYFWVPQQTSFMTMTFQLLKKEEQINRVDSVTNAAVPTSGVEKMVTITPRTAWFEDTLTNLSQLTDNIGVVTHIANTSNPHSVTKAQVGLGNVTNQSKATMFTNPTFTGTGSFSSTLSADRIVVTSTSNVKHLEFSRSDYNYITSKGHIGFITGGTGTSSANQQVWIHSNGNTKIGAGSSSVPAYTLDVNGTGRFTGNLTAANTEVDSLIVNDKTYMYDDLNMYGGDITTSAINIGDNWSLLTEYSDTVFVIKYGDAHKMRITTSGGGGVDFYGNLFIQDNLTAGNIVSDNDITGYEVEAYETVITPQVELGANWKLEQVGTELVFKSSNSVKQSFYNDGRIEASSFIGDLSGNADSASYVKSSGTIKTDYNNYRTEGIYTIFSDAGQKVILNRPTDSSGVLEVTNSTSTSTSGWIFQRFQSYGNDSIYTRRRYGTTWTTWKESYHTGNFANGTTSQYIRGDGSLATYKDTTYSEITEAQTVSTSSSSVRLITGRRLKYAFDNITAANATNATNINTLPDNSSNASRFILFSDAATGNQRVKTDSGLKYNPSTNTITAKLSGNASSATTATNCGRSVVAGDGLTGGGALSANRTLTLGTPSAITLSSKNSVGTDSHTHAFTPGGTTSQYIRGDGSLATYANTTYSAGTLALLEAGANTSNRVWSAKILNDWLANKFKVVTALPTSPTAGVFYFVKE